MRCQERRQAQLQTRSLTMRGLARSDCRVRPTRLCAFFFIEGSPANEICQPETRACGWSPRRAYPAFRSCGRVAEGGGLLNRYRVVKPYRGFESLRLRMSTFGQAIPYEQSRGWRHTAAKNSSGGLVTDL